MKFKHVAAALTVALGFMGWSQCPSVAGVIDTRPPDGFISFDLDLGADTAGGTFTADDINLASFTLTINPGGGGGVFRAIVLGTAGGVPTGTPLWESADTDVPAVVTEFVFMPNLAITVGSQYFIGIDTGLRTDTDGGRLQIGVRITDFLPGGQWYEDLNDAGFTGFAELDIASRIVMNAAPVPEPATLALLGLGLAGLGLTRRRMRG